VSSPPAALPSRPPLWRLVLAFAAVYVIWGSTYLAIRFAIETVPPLFMAGTRYLIAGGILYAWARGRGEAPPRRVHLRAIVLIGGALLLLGNGGVVVAEQWVASGATALLVASEPFWVILFNALRRGGERPTPGMVAGLLLGFVGVFFLVSPFREGVGIELRGAVIIFLAAAAWAAGSLYAQRARLPESALVSTASQMLAGGALLLAASGAAGEWGRVELAAVSGRSAGAYVYLIVFGSLVAFSAYAWLVRVAHPASVSTYAFVNPMVAVFLGWLLAGEEVSARTFAAGGLILAGVGLITAAGAARADRARRALAEAPAPAGVAPPSVPPEALPVRRAGRWRPRRPAA
jgi:drug/metabolite transporter (DMT)-like permease